MLFFEHCCEPELFPNAEHVWHSRGIRQGSPNPNPSAVPRAQRKVAELGGLEAKQLAAGGGQAQKPPTPQPTFCASNPPHTPPATAQGRKGEVGGVGCLPWEHQEALKGAAEGGKQKAAGRGGTLPSRTSQEWRRKRQYWGGGADLKGDCGTAAALRSEPGPEWFCAGAHVCVSASVSACLCASRRGSRARRG